jgi:hypothetical protein
MEPPRSDNLSAAPKPTQVAVTGAKSALSDRRALMRRTALSCRAVPGALAMPSSAYAAPMVFQVASWFGCALVAVAGVSKPTVGLSAA